MAECELVIRNGSKDEPIARVKIAPNDAQQALPPVPERLVLLGDDYTRDRAMLELPPAAVMSADTAEFGRFAGYLRERGKAARSATFNGATRLVVLPPPSSSSGGSTLSIAFHTPHAESTAAARRPPTPPEAEQAPAKRARLDAAPAAPAAPVAAASSGLEPVDRDEMVHRDCATGGVVYYQDSRKRYKFTAGPKGLELLTRLVRANEAGPLHVVERLLDKFAPAERDAAVREGEQLYAEKPTLRGEAGVTWSDAEYAHRGLQRQYLRFKSFQRFTETYSLVERASARGLFQRALPPPGPDGAPSRAARIASIGGGPGYELLALREFLRELAPPLRVELTSVDLQPGWEPFARALDCGFITADLNDGDMLSRCGAPLDIVVISYVLIYCSNEATAAMFARLLRAEGGPRAILVSERTHRQEMAALMERQGVTVTKLMPQHRGRDERQMVWTLSDLPSREPRNEGDLTFPNVPYQRGT